MPNTAELRRLKARHNRILVALLAAVGLACVLDWGFSFGPITEMAVSRCVSAHEGAMHEVFQESDGGFISGTGEQEEYADYEIEDACKEAKRNGRLNLSGGGIVNL